MSGTTTPLLYRQRLLDLLPDSPGHVVWLHAPLGYGKSILASQWAEEREINGWRVLWTRSDGKSVHSAIADALRLPANASWQLISEELALENSLLVIEDLEGPEDLQQVLRNRNHTLLLLASRGPLHEPEIARLHTQGQLHELKAADLAFTLEEAEQLAVNNSKVSVARLWSDTGGWPLPLHFAMLTGSTAELPMHATLRRSLAPANWREALLLAAAGELEHDAATEATRELVNAGLLQQLERHYRLHPLLADHILTAVPDEVRQALGQSRERLAPIARVRALERTGHATALRAELEQLPYTTVADHSREIMQYINSQTTDLSPALELRKDYAQLMLSPADEVINRLQERMRAADVPVNERLDVLIHGAVILSRHALDEPALRYLAEAAELVHGQPLATQLYYELSRAVVHSHAERHLEAFTATRQLLELAGDSNQPGVREFVMDARLHNALCGFQVTGDFRFSLSQLRQLLTEADLGDQRRARLLLNGAVFHAYSNEHEQALALAAECRKSAAPYVRFAADYLIAYLAEDLGAFPDLLMQAHNWGIHDAAERVGALWLRLLRRLGDSTTALRIVPQLSAGPFVWLEQALLEHAHGREASAQALLEKARDGYKELEFQWHWQAASFLINGGEAEFEKLLALSPYPELVVRYTVIPLERLPRNRPELSVAYPLREVLNSGWAEAVRLRLKEIPPLELQLLGCFSVRVLGEPVQLPARQQQLLALMALGANRVRSADQLWPESDSERTTNNLNVQLHSLRKALEPWSVPTYLLDGGLRNVRLDVQLLREAMELADPDAVLRLCRGELLPEFDLPDIQAERSALHEQIITFLTSSAEAAEPIKALPMLERILELDPLHEPAIELLVDNLLKVGRRTAARERLSRFQRLLQEIGLEPGKELFGRLQGQ